MPSIMSRITSKLPIDDGIIPSKVFIPSLKQKPGTFGPVLKNGKWILGGLVVCAALCGIAVLIVNYLLKED